MDRKQFTYYESFLIALDLLSFQDRAILNDAIIRYALRGIEPENLTAYQQSIFESNRPNLDTAQKRAKQFQKNKAAKKDQEPAAGRKKAAASKKKEAEDPLLPGFTAFWELYPCRVDREGALESYRRLKPDDQLQGRLLDSLAAWKKSGQWQEEGGKFIPRAANFLDKGFYNEIPKEPSRKPEVIYGASGELGRAELEAIRNIMAMDTEGGLPAGL